MPFKASHKTKIKAKSQPAITVKAKEESARTKKVAEKERGHMRLEKKRFLKSQEASFVFGEVCNLFFVDEELAVPSQPLKEEGGEAASSSDTRPLQKATPNEDLRPQEPQASAASSSSSARGPSKWVSVAMHGWWKKTYNTARRSRSRGGGEVELPESD
jgi:hypothetical protein